MKYIFRPHHSKMTTLCAVFEAGTRAEFGTKYPNGIAHFQEHMRFKGTDRYTSKELAEQVSLLGGDSNAFTSSGCVAYHIEVPEENTQAGLELLAEIALRPIFPEAEMQKEKEVVCQEIRNYNDDLGSLVYDTMYKKVFNNALSLSTLGTEESVRSITQEDLINFDREFYGTDNMMLLVSGQNNPRTDNFGHSGGAYSVKSLPAAVYPSSFTHKFVKEGFEQDNLFIAFGSKEMEELAIKKRAAVKVFNYIFGGGADSRLFQKVREDQGLVYGIYSRMDPDYDGTLFEISTSTDPKNTEAVLGAVQECVKEFTSLKENELLKTKNCLRSNYYRTLDTSTSTLFTALKEEMFGFSAQKVAEEVQNVSEKDVMEVAEVVFSANQYTVVGSGGE